MFNRIIHWSVHNPYVVTAGAVFFLVIGLVVASRMPIDVFPEITPPRVVVVTEAHGMAPEEVEPLVSLPIEAALNGAPNVVRVESVSSPGVSVVTVDFALGTNIYFARQIVAEKLQLATARFPPGVGPPVMGPISSLLGEAIEFSLSSDTMDELELRAFMDWVVRIRLLSVPGVSWVVNIGGGVKQYQVLPDPNKLRHYNLTFAQVAHAAKHANENAPGGWLENYKGQELLVRTLGRAYTLEDLANSVVTVRNGVPILLKQVADVQFGHLVKRGEGSFKGQAAVVGTVQKQLGTNTLVITRLIEDVLQKVKEELPPGVRLDIGYRQADFIEAAMRNLRAAIWEGGIFVTLVLFVFLFNFRTTFISLTAIPLSLLLSLLVVHQLGLTINAMLLGGFAIAIGELVDDAIIDVENVLRRLRENRHKPPGERRSTLEVIYRASTEIRNSIVYATFIIVLVFLPLFFLTGIEGRMFAPVGIAYITTMLASLLVALTVTPALCVFLLPRGGLLEKRESATYTWLKQHYRRMLEYALTHPGRVVGVSTALLVLALALVPFFGKEFLPSFAEGSYRVFVFPKPGISLAESDKLGRLGEQILLRYPEIPFTMRKLGRAETDEHASGVHYNEIQANFKAGGRSYDEVRRLIRQDLQQIPGVVTAIAQPIGHRIDDILTGTTASVVVKLFGPDLGVLRAKAKEIEAVMSRVRGVADLQVEQLIPVPQLLIRPNRDKAARYGLTMGDIGEVADHVLKGTTASQVLEQLRTFDIWVRLPEPARNDLRAIENLLIDTPTGEKVLLKEVADLTLGAGPNAISRESVMRRLLITSNVQGRDLNSFVAEVRERVKNEVKLPPAYFVVYGGQFEAQERAQDILTWLSLLIILGIFVLLFQAFKRARYALMVMANLPLALIGGVWAVFLTGGVLTIASLIGFIVLLGVATRNGIILVTHYEHLMDIEQRPFEGVVIEGSLDRLAPVLMTALAAGLGLLPMAWGGGAGKELNQPLAIVALGGLGTSTFLNLIVVPTLFQRFGRPRLRGETPAVEAPVQTPDMSLPHGLRP